MKYDAIQIKQITFYQCIKWEKSMIFLKMKPFVPFHFHLPFPIPTNAVRKNPRSVPTKDLKKVGSRLSRLFGGHLVQCDDTLSCNEKNNGCIAETQTIFWLTISWWIFSIFGYKAAILPH